MNVRLHRHGMHLLQLRSGSVEADGSSTADATCNVSMMTANARRSFTAGGLRTALPGADKSTQQ